MDRTKINQSETRSKQQVVGRAGQPGSPTYRQQVGTRQVPQVILHNNTVNTTRAAQLLTTRDRIYRVLAKGKG